MSEERKPKLHELLVVEGDIEGEFKTIAEETKNTFGKKPDHFLAHIKTLKMHDEKRTKEEEGAGESKEMVTTVPVKLRYARKSAERYIDALLQKELTNQKAHATLEVGGVPIAEDLPATFLLGLEHRLKVVRDYLTEIPTLAPGVKWVADPEAGTHIYKAADPELRQKTEKSFAFKVLHEATKEHRAEIEKWTTDVVVGTFSTVKRCGMLSPAQKSSLLGRVDTLIQAVKSARQRANMESVVKRTIGAQLMEFILGDLG